MLSVQVVRSEFPIQAFSLTLALARWERKFL
jgi:hypothetical protein